MHIAPYDNQNKPIVDADDGLRLTVNRDLKLNLAVGRKPSRPEATPSRETLQFHLRKLATLWPA